MTDQPREHVVKRSHLQGGLPGYAVILRYACDQAGIGRYYAIPTGEQISIRDETAAKGWTIRPAPRITWEQVQALSDEDLLCIPLCGPRVLAAIRRAQRQVLGEAEVTEQRPLITVRMTRIDAEVWHFDGIEVDPSQMDGMEDADYADQVYQDLRDGIREVFYGLGYVFDDDEPLESAQ